MREILMHPVQALYCVLEYTLETQSAGTIRIREVEKSKTLDHKLVSQQGHLTETTLQS